jgi:Lrp/AsnC family transcriptional regulator for asnA, asnC and gidA
VKVEVDALDKKIIIALYQDVRASYKGIADRLGVSHNTVRARMERLLRDKIIRFAVVTDPPKVGFAVTAYLSLNVEPEHLESVGRTLCERREVSYLGHTIGNEDIIALAHFENNELLFRFVNVFLGNLEGVVAVRTTIVCETLKGLPDRHGPIGGLGVGEEEPAAMSVAS